jgi:hypothetical protein
MQVSSSTSCRSPHATTNYYHYLQARRPAPLLCRSVETKQAGAQTAASAGQEEYIEVRGA